ncbi:MAG TPA: VOC family protein, partial [Ktedonobacterales bacterium]|nr:VOC family protein [Ktedonobacterales bacterium]
IPQAAAFYHDVLGFDIVAQMPTALFVSAGGYHHHIGMNIWHSRNAPAAPAGTAGLRVFTLELPTEASREAVLARVQAAGIAYTREGAVVRLHDPWQNAILLTVGAVADANAVNTLRAATAL